MQINHTTALKEIEETKKERGEGLNFFHKVGYYAEVE